MTRPDRLKYIHIKTVKKLIYIALRYTEEYGNYPDSAKRKDLVKFIMDTTGLKKTQAYEYCRALRTLSIWFK